MLNNRSTQYLSNNSKFTSRFFSTEKSGAAEEGQVEVDVEDDRTPISSNT